MICALRSTVDRPEVQVPEDERVLGGRVRGLESRLELPPAPLEHVRERGPPLAPPRVAGGVRREMTR